MRLQRQDVHGSGHRKHTRPPPWVLVTSGRDPTLRTAGPGAGGGGQGGAGAAPSGEARGGRPLLGCRHQGGGRADPPPPSFPRSGHRWPLPGSGRRRNLPWCREGPSPWSPGSSSSRGLTQAPDIWPHPAPGLRRCSGPRLLPVPSPRPPSPGPWPRALPTPPPARGLRD